MYGMKVGSAIPARAIISTSDGQQFYAVPIGTHWIIPIPRWLLNIRDWFRRTFLRAEKGT
jgi:hypothetical protein